MLLGFKENPMTSRWLGIVVAVFAVTSAQAQTSMGTGSTATRTGSDTPQQQAPSYRSMPSRPSAPSGPSVSGSDISTPQAGSANGSFYGDSSIGGSGSAGLAAMGGGVSAGSSATSQMGAGAMTDCPMGTMRKMGLCVPYGQAHKKPRP